MIGIIGFGRFGRLIAQYLSKDYNVLVHSQSTSSRDIEKHGASSTNLEMVCAQQFVIPCVPISAFKDTLYTISPMLGKGTIVADVCSVKILPVQWMREILPPAVSILPTHPMFGPDSASHSLSGSKMVLCKDRLKQHTFSKIKKYLSDKGIEIIVCSPDEHDRQIAVSLSLTHFIGRSLSEFGATSLEIDTEGYKRLLHILGVVKNDTWQLFMDMNQYNPYAQKYRDRFIRALKQVEAKLN